MAPSRETPVLETRNLDKRFGGITAASGISIAIRKGARHALIGPNGAGKTTFVNLLTGVLRPSGGNILLDGAAITHLEPHQRVRLGIARTFQINQLFADLTPIESLGLAISERHGAGRDWWRRVGSKSAITDEIAELLERFGLTDVMAAHTATLPYGKQRLLEMALAFACRPRVLLLDEPAAGVPEAERHDMAWAGGAARAASAEVRVEVAAASAVWAVDRSADLGRQQLLVRSLSKPPIQAGGPSVANPNHDGHREFGEFLERICLIAFF